jgi:hypothetical protein
MPSRAPRFVRASLWTALLCFAACGGGGGDDGSSGAPRPGRPTTFIGNVDQRAVLSGAASGSASAVQVCVAGTSFCTEVDDTGAFTLAADVGGDVVLLFEGPSFSARLALADVPRGATVRIQDIQCNLVSGVCRADEVEIVGPLNAPPDCSAAVARPALLWPPNHAMVLIAIDGVVDPDGDRVLITATDAAQDEPVDAPGSGNTAPDVRLDPLAVRAERSGQGDGRIYTIRFVADDGHGGTCDGIVEVCVPHDRGQAATCG